jgi:4'-phosphopantetheinyl transferase
MKGPDSRELGLQDVHVWVVRLEASEDNFALALSFLSADEKARAERFRFERHARAFVLGRAGLRALLGSYLGAEPAEISFIYGPQGKPALADTSCSLRFNASNSGSLAAYAVTTGCEIGIDVEQHRENPEFEKIAHRFFSPEEAAELLELPDHEKTAAFYRCWTRKEAFIKAVGGGLSIPLDSFRVSLRPGAAARMISLDGSIDAARSWTLDSFDPGPGYTGAIAYHGQLRGLHARIVASTDALLDKAASIY